MMFEGKDQQTLQSIIDNGAITPESQRTPKQALDAIRIAIKAKDHYWHFWDEILSDVHQLSNGDIHALNI